MLLSRLKGFRASSNCEGQNNTSFLPRYTLFWPYEIRALGPSLRHAAVMLNFEKLTVPRQWHGNALGTLATPGGDVIERRQISIRVGVWFSNSTIYFDYSAIFSWRNNAPGAPATPGGAVLGGRQIVIKMWDNFARLTALLAKVRVCFNNLTIYLDFSAIFSQIAPRKPLKQGRHWGATFCRRGAPFRRGLQRYATGGGGNILARPPT